MHAHRPNPGSRTSGRGQTRQRCGSEGRRRRQRGCAGVPAAAEGGRAQADGRVRRWCIHRGVALRGCMQRPAAACSCQRAAGRQGLTESSLCMHRASKFLHTLDARSMVALFTTRGAGQMRGTCRQERPVAAAAMKQGALPAVALVLEKILRFRRAELRPQWRAARANKVQLERRWACLFICVHECGVHHLLVLIGCGHSRGALPRLAQRLAAPRLRSQPCGHQQPARRKRGAAAAAASGTGE